ncbi:rhomboid family intramembrane serine protease [Frigidibacter sp. ROC022]|uniref:rhomboid family intramembrane serine protease n=1 Tax=Frigidibacter sp. ROC022 TaxID=2971796 RepID=UPI00215A6BB9|nr:rhomboid family intramembrane serine protease [Frigidibacter sp. ROC022]MCR8723021.1 rhomboid family intramembrane serine protease [Frigidibacter sp. ROC022]
MFPIRDHNPSARTPVVTYALIAANVLVYLAMLPAAQDGRALYDIYNTYALVPAEFSAGYDRWTLLTSAFMHGGILHLAGNMLFLWIFGDNLEDQMGHLPYLGFYLAAGMAAGLAQVGIDPTSRVPMVGASGAIGGVLGGYMLLFPRARVDMLLIVGFFVRMFTLPAWMLLGFWLGLQLVLGLANTGAEGGVAYWAHVGGFIAGLILTLPLWLRRGGGGYWSRTEGRPPHPPGPVPQTRIPRVPRRKSR